MKMVIVKDFECINDLKRGECIVLHRHDNRDNLEEITSYGLAICCPRCGEVSTGKHKYDPETKSLHPSIVHTCGYHAWLRNGVFEEC